MAKQQLSYENNPFGQESEYDRNAFESYLSLYPVEGIRLNVSILVMFFLNLFIAIPVFSVPYESFYAYVLLPPLAIMNLWALALIIAPKKLQLNYVLFRGVFGIVCSMGFLIVTQKFAYSVLQLNTPWYGIGSFAAYGFALYSYIRSHVQKLKKPRDERQKRSGMSIVSLTVVTGLGYLLANLSLMFVNGETVTIVLMCVYAMLAFIVFHFILEIHRYYWLRRVQDKTHVHRK